MNIDVVSCAAAIPTRAATSGQISGGVYEIAHKDRHQNESKEGLSGRPPWGGGGGGGLERCKSRINGPELQRQSLKSLKPLKLECLGAPPQKPLQTFLKPPKPVESILRYLKREPKNVESILSSPP